MPLDPILSKLSTVLTVLVLLGVFLRGAFLGALPGVALTILGHIMKNQGDSMPRRPYSSTGKRSKGSQPLSKSASCKTSKGTSGQHTARPRTRMLDS